jgi:hypothetical protein
MSRHLGDVSSTPASANCLSFSILSTVSLSLYHFPALFCSSIRYAKPLRSSLHQLTLSSVSSYKFNTQNKIKLNLTVTTQKHTVEKICNFFSINGCGIYNNQFAWRHGTAKSITVHWHTQTQARHFASTIYHKYIFIGATRLHQYTEEL